MSEPLNPIRADDTAGIDEAIGMNGSRLIEKSWAERDFPKTRPLWVDKKLLGLDFMIWGFVIAIWVLSINNFEFALMAYQGYCFLPLVGSEFASMVFVENGFQEKLRREAGMPVSSTGTGDVSGEGNANVLFTRGSAGGVGSSATSAAGASVHSAADVVAGKAGTVLAARPDAILNEKGHMKLDSVDVASANTASGVGAFRVLSSAGVATIKPENPSISSTTNSRRSVTVMPQSKLSYLRIDNLVYAMRPSNWGYAYAIRKVGAFFGMGNESTNRSRSSSSSSDSDTTSSRKTTIPENNISLAEEQPKSSLQERHLTSPDTVADQSWDDSLFGVNMPDTQHELAADPDLLVVPQCAVCESSPYYSLYALLFFVFVRYLWYRRHHAKTKKWFRELRENRVNTGSNPTETEGETPLESENEWQKVIWFARQVQKGLKGWADFLPSIFDALWYLWCKPDTVCYNLVKVELEHSDVVVLGSCHVGPGSMGDVIDVAERIKPDAVAIELDRSRFRGVFEALEDEMMFRDVLEEEFEKQGKGDVADREGGVKLLLRGRGEPAQMKDGSSGGDGVNSSVSRSVNAPPSLSMGGKKADSKTSSKMSHSPTPSETVDFLKKLRSRVECPIKRQGLEISSFKIDADVAEWNMSTGGNGSVVDNSELVFWPPSLKRVLASDKIAHPDIYHDEWDRICKRRSSYCGLVRSGFSSSQGSDTTGGCLDCCEQTSPTAGSSSNTKYTRLIQEGGDSPTSKRLFSPKVEDNGNDNQNISDGTGIVGGGVGIMDVIHHRNRQFDSNFVTNKIVVVANIWPWDTFSGLSRPKRIAYEAQKAGAKGVLLVEIPALCISPKEIYESGLWSKYVGLWGKHSVYGRLDDRFLGDSVDIKRVRAYKALEMGSKKCTWPFLFRDWSANTGNLYGKAMREEQGENDSTWKTREKARTRANKIMGGEAGYVSSSPNDGLPTEFRKGMWEREREKEERERLNGGSSPTRRSARTFEPKKKIIRFQSDSVVQQTRDRLANGKWWICAGDDANDPNIPLFAVSPTEKFVEICKDLNNSDAIRIQSASESQSSTAQDTQDDQDQTTSKKVPLWKRCFLSVIGLLLLPIVVMYAVIGSATQHVGQEFGIAHRIATHRKKATLLADSNSEEFIGIIFRTVLNPSLDIIRFFAGIPRWYFSFMLFPLTDCDPWGTTLMMFLRMPILIYLVAFIAALFANMVLLVEYEVFLAPIIDGINGVMGGGSGDSSDASSSGSEGQDYGMPMTTVPKVEVGMMRRFWFVRSSTTFFPSFLFDPNALFSWLLTLLIINAIYAGFLDYRNKYMVYNIAKFGRDVAERDMGSGSMNRGKSKKPLILAVVGALHMPGMLHLLKNEKTFLEGVEAGIRR